MSDIDTKIAAIIMIGGLSSRMGGGIKSLIKFNNLIKPKMISFV